MAESSSESEEGDGDVGSFWSSKSPASAGKKRPAEQSFASDLFDDDGDDGDDGDDDDGGGGGGQGGCKRAATAALAAPSPVQAVTPTAQVFQGPASAGSGSSLLTVLPVAVQRMIWQFVAYSPRDMQRLERVAPSLARETGVNLLWQPIVNFRTEAAAKKAYRPWAKSAGRATRSPSQPQSSSLSSASSSSSSSFSSSAAAAAPPVCTVCSLIQARYDATSCEMCGSELSAAPLPSAGASSRAATAAASSVSAGIRVESLSHFRLLVGEGQRAAAQPAAVVGAALEVVEAEAAAPAADGSFSAPLSSSSSSCEPFPMSSTTTTAGLVGRYLERDRAFHRRSRRTADFIASLDNSGSSSSCGPAAARDGAAAGASAAGSAAATGGIGNGLAVQVLLGGSVGGGSLHGLCRFQVKAAVRMQRIARGWGSLKEGWRALAKQLLQPTSGISGGSGGGGGSDEATTERLVRKLTAKNWPLCFDSVCALLELAAEATSLELAQQYLGAADRPIVSPASPASPASPPPGKERALQALQTLQGLVLAYSLFFKVVGRIDGLAEDLNDRIAVERSAAFVNCSSVLTPYIRTAGLAAFRDHVLCAWPLTSVLEDSLRGWLASQGLVPSGGGRGGGAFFTDRELLENNRCLDVVCGGVGVGGGGGSKRAAIRCLWQGCLKRPKGCNQLCDEHTAVLQGAWHPVHDDKLDEEDDDAATTGKPEDDLLGRLLEMVEELDRLPEPNDEAPGVKAKRSRLRSTFLVSLRRANLKNKRR